MKPTNWLPPEEAADIIAETSSFTKWCKNLMTNVLLSVCIMFSAYCWFNHDWLTGEPYESDRPAKIDCPLCDKKAVAVDISEYFTYYHCPNRHRTLERRDPKWFESRIYKCELWPYMVPPPSVEER